MLLYGQSIPLISLKFHPGLLEFVLRSIDCQREFERVRARHVRNWSITFGAREAGGKIEIMPDNFLYHTPSIEEEWKRKLFWWCFKNRFRTVVWISKCLKWFDKKNFVQKKRKLHTFIFVIAGHAEFKLCHKCHVWIQSQWNKTFQVG